MTEKQNDELDLNSGDAAVEVVSGIIGAIPGLGPLMSKMFDMAIPRNRMDRFADTLRRAVSKIDDLEDFKNRIETPEGMDFIEEVLDQSRTALTEERREYIGNLFKNSINRDDLDHIQNKDLFRLLSELNDIEILYLKQYSLNLSMRSANHPFWVKHQAVLCPVTRSTSATPEDRRRAAFEDLYINHINELGLVNMQTSAIHNARPTGVTELGRMLLDYIEVPED